LRESQTQPFALQNVGVAQVPVEPVLIIAVICSPFLQVTTTVTNLQSIGAFPALIHCCTIASVVTTCVPTPTSRRPRLH
jgi:hypothetical protein